MGRYSINLRWFALAVYATCFLSWHISAQQQPQPLVDKFILHETIQPVSQGELEQAIARANSDGAQALLIEMDTPGGMVESMRAMVAAELASRVPVIVFVAPSGARAGSAGFFLLEAADIAAMAPGTEAGAAHVVYEFGKPDATMQQKIENDAEAFLRSFVTRRNRNAEAATAALQNSKSYTAEEALIPDVITQRLLKAWLAKQTQPYSEDQLNAIAQRCTEREDAARKVERDMRKRIAAVALHPHIGQSYSAIVTGVNQYGTFVRSLDPHVEGMLVRGGKGLDVGDRVTVKLVSTDPARGFIDFAI